MSAGSRSHTHAHPVSTVGMPVQDGFTPLLIAAGTGHIEVVKTLLGAGADKEATNEVSGPLACA